MALFLSTKPRKSVIIKGAAALTAVSLLTGCGFFQKSFSEKNEERRTVPFEQMQAEEVDSDRLTQQIQAAAEQVDNCKNLEELLKLEESFSQQSEQFSTAAAMANLNTYLDTTDEQARERSENLSKQGEQLNNEITEYLKAVMQSDLREEYRKEMGEYVSSIIDRQLKTNSPAAVEPMQKRQELDNEYNELLSNLRVEADGKQMRIDEVLAPDAGLSQEQLLEAIGEYYLGNYETFANLYLEMIALDKQAATACGYEDAVQWRYDSFGRDYTPQDSEKMFEEIKEWIVPWMDEMEYSDAMSVSLEQEKGVAAVEKTVSQADPLLKEVWGFMQTNNLFSFDPLPEKMSGVAFTMDLPQYDAPFVYSYWGGEVKDAFTVLHEFGHAVDSYAQFGNEAYMTDLDKAETFSQGLEQVLQAKLANELGLDEEYVMQAVWMDTVQAITYQAALEEFQIKAYALDENATPKDLAELFAEVLSEYGYYTVFGNFDPTWFEVTHLFDAPFYTMSYVTSATAALELGRMEAEQTGMFGKQGKGLEAWLKLTQTERNQSFGDFLNSAGIASPFEEGRIRECGEFLESRLVPQSVDKAA